MISERHVRNYCRDDISKIENYEQAVNDTTHTWVCHHKDECKLLPSGIIVLRTMEELKEIGRYYNCPANELIFLTNSEHWKLHHKFGSIDYNKVALKTKEAMKNVSKDKLAYWKGKKQSESTKEKRRKKLKLRVEAYNKYKAKGGTLKFNDFQHKLYRFIEANNKEVKHEQSEQLSSSNKK